MDGIAVAWQAVKTAIRFFFWTVIERVTRAIYANKVANQELLILKPRLPKDLYAAGYVIFVYDITWDAWRGYWRTPNHQPGDPAAEIYEIKSTTWPNVPFHEVEFTGMPEITFKCRAVSLDWCRREMPLHVEDKAQPEARTPPAAPVEEPGKVVH